MEDGWILKKISKLEDEILELRNANSELKLRILRLEQNNPDMEAIHHVRPSPVRSLNCWEVKKCGREPGGSRALELGICPAAEMEHYSGINRGKNGGRVCWAIVGTLCGGKVQGVFAEKVATCMNCDFYKAVEQQEGRDFRHALLPKENKSKKK